MKEGNDIKIEKIFMYFCIRQILSRDIPTDGYILRYVRCFLPMTQLVLIVHYGLIKGHLPQIR